MDVPVERNKPPKYSTEGNLSPNQLSLTPNILEANLTENMPLVKISKIYVRETPGSLEGQTQYSSEMTTFTQNFS